MAIWNLGSINADMFYSVPHLPGPGETLASTQYRRGLGGKGANISVAAARAAGRVFHIGAIGTDGVWARDLLLEYGVDPNHIAVLETPTGHAIIAVDHAGENNIILFPGANQEIGNAQVKGALSQASVGDWLVCQNETNGQSDAMKIAQQLGLKVAYVAAPFDANSVADVLPYLDLLILNEVEAEQLTRSLDCTVQSLNVRDVIITLGSRGAIWHHAKDAAVEIEPVAVSAVDSTGAGDTFAGYVIACLDRGLPMKQALTTANLAAAIMVTRHGTADVIPDLKDLEDFRLA